TVCLSNLQQIAVALQTYMKGNRDYLPFAVQNPWLQKFAPPSPPEKPLMALQDVLKRELSIGGNSKAEVRHKVFECPADQILDQDDIDPATLAAMLQNGSRWADSAYTSSEWNPYLNGKRINYRKVTIYEGIEPAFPKDVFLL